MKSIKFFILMVVITMVATTASARTWRVNPNSMAGAQYTSISDLMNNAEFAEGDTILCDAGSYEGVDISRKNITIIGPGYLLDENTTWDTSQSAIFTGWLYLSEGSTAIGIYTYSGLSLKENCEVTRCRLRYYIQGYYSSTSQCKVYGCYLDYGTGIISLTNSLIYNNIINGGLSNLTSCEIFNNTIVYNQSGPSSSEIINFLPYSNLYDNIIINYSTEVDGETGKPYSSSRVINFDYAKDNATVLTNNVFSISSTYAEENYPNNYYVGATVENTFVNEGSSDAKYMLKDGSPAQGAASNGGDCGAFGGAATYVLSGIPLNMPQITHSSVPGRPTDGKLNISLTIATQDE